ncbi:polysaccharide deacetylase family protein [Flavobacterium silvaticum]|uniref:Polysaccharide deacetylase family protein n=1 Tax=Flavobacterium silvaticum TaxID=1852020 RepID=A0A972FQH4_9FLAO|nr:polysaccharide deacetylase family protein [Flavobacterium silvaticum]NMH29500.1 polysaccharide deacetylase family protein [Flavobacterium silvaticum]
MPNGNFIISLDFELHWGAPEEWDLSQRKPYFDATRLSIPKVLSLFSQYHIRATWATVGFLFAKNKEQLLQFLPKERPSYLNQELSYYRLIDSGEAGNDESDDPYHFASSLIEKILETEGQELGTHTFAHYYCLENGQNVTQFDLDLKAAQAISRENFNTTLRSLVFPRNQFNPEYLEVAAQNGIKVVRTNPDLWFWKSTSRFIPLARAVDTLMPISGSTVFHDMKMEKGVQLHKASRFLRPYAEKEKVIRELRLKRIFSEMTHAAKTRGNYHLWWHPHNFGYFTKENLVDLERILNHFKMLNENYGFSSKNMIDLNG